MSRSITDRIYARTGIAVRRRDLRADRDAQLAIAALIGRVAGGDGSETAEETVVAVALLKQRFGMHGTEALELLGRGREAWNGRATAAILAELDSRLGMPEKEDLLLMLLDVVAADHTKDPRELDLLADTARALDIPASIVDRAISQYLAARRGTRR